MRTEFGLVLGAVLSVLTSLAQAQTLRLAPAEPTDVTRHAVAPGIGAAREQVPQRHRITEGEICPDQRRALTDTKRRLVAQMTAPVRQSAPDLAAIRTRPKGTSCAVLAGQAVFQGHMQARSGGPLPHRHRVAAGLSGFCARSLVVRFSRLTGLCGARDLGRDNRVNKAGFRPGRPGPKASSLHCRVISGALRLPMTPVQTTRAFQATHHASRFACATSCESGGWITSLSLARRPPQHPDRTFRAIHLCARKTGQTHDEGMLSGAKRTVRTGAETAPRVILASGPTATGVQGAEGLLAQAQALIGPSGAGLNDPGTVRRVAAILDRIIAEHPESDLALQILLQETVGGLDIAAIRLAAAAPLPAAPTDSATTLGLLGAAEAIYDAALVGPDAMRGPQLQSVRAILDQILATDPTSMTAAAIRRGGMVGRIDIAILSPPTIAILSPPTPALPPIAAPQVPPAPQVSAVPLRPTPAPAPATEADETALSLDDRGRRQVQARLQVIGHDPNGIDGRFGRGTRAAIRAWQQAAGFAPTGFLNAVQWAALQQQSETAFQAFRTVAANRRLVEPERFEPTPGALAGQWRLSARCGPRSRIPNSNVTGTLTVQHEGRGQYRGRYANSQGLRGSFVARQQGRTITGTLRFEGLTGILTGPVQVTGELSEYLPPRFTGRDSNGCSLSARRG